MNEILLRRKNKIILERGNASSPEDAYIITIMKNVESLGYIFSKELFKVLRTLRRDELQKFYLELVPILKNLIGADVVYHPMYPNFPMSVMREEEALLYLNAMVHYWSGGVLYSYVKKDKRLPFHDETKIKVLDLGTKEELQEIFTNLCKSKTSISQTDKEDIAWIFKNLQVKFPDVIPLKENAAFIGMLYLENNPLAGAEELKKYMKTATDVLRLITAMSDGDVSLSENTKFRSFKRRERRILLELLQNCGASLEEEMLKYKNRWIRVGERLHPGEYKAEQFGRVKTAFAKLRNDEKIETFAGAVARTIREEDYTETLELLKSRPGELARKLDHLLRISNSPEDVIEIFCEVAGRVSTPVLLQVREHFRYRTEKPESRVFFPKGNLARSYCIPYNLPDMKAEYCDAIVEVCEKVLIENYRKEGSLGKVYLAEEFEKYLVPFSQRSASKALKTIVRGSRLPIAENAKALRAFIWWTNMDTSADEDAGGRIDIDLSAAIFDENWRYIEHVSYTNLRSKQYKACHSGDIVNGGPINGEGVSEFLDVDIESVVRYGARYVVYQVYNYTRQKYSDIPCVKFGWMNREDVKSGEIYEPRSVEQKMDLAAPSTVSIPVIFDCVKRELIWCDMNLSLGGCLNEENACNTGGNNVENNLKGVAATCYGIVNLRKPSLYDLIELHIKARGVRTDKKEDADVIFDVDEGITPFDTDVFMCEYI